MLIALVSVVIFFLFIMAAALTMLWYLNRNPGGSSKPNLQEDEELQVEDKPSQRIHRHIGELINFEEVEPGIIYADGQYLALARIEGTNFSILSDGEQDAREDALITIQNQIKYPIQYITSTVITDTDITAEQIRQQASKTKNTELNNYCLLYAVEMEDMKRRRQAMAQVSWIVISDNGARGLPGKPSDRIKEKMLLLKEAFRSRVGIILTPLATTEEVIDALQQIILPEKLTKASETALLGLHPIKFNIKEIEKIA